MFKELGGLLGWLLIITIAGTILNYCLKLVNRHFGKKISASPIGKRTLKVLMTIFVRNHRYFGVAAVVLLMIHFSLQFFRYGLNVTGFIAALLLISQVSVGIYAISKKKPRRGAWFFVHRVISAVLVLSIALHLILPNALNLLLQKEESVKISDSVSVSELPTFTLEELAKYNGENGQKAYVAYKGSVYDITEHSEWNNGKHNGNTAGTDLTDAIKKSPHGDSKFNSLEIVGTIK